MNYLTKSFLIVGFCYVTAIIFAIITGVLISTQYPDIHPLWMLAIVDSVATIVVFGFSVAFRNASFYDPYWSVGPIVIVGYYLMTGGGSNLLVREIILTGVVVTWGVRLTWNWARGWTGLDHEDWRYIDLRKKTGIFYPLVNFFGIHYFPTVLVFLGCLPLWPGFVTGTQPLNWLDILGLIIAGGGIYLETRADRELYRFRQSQPPKEAILDTGLWKYSRHPNYLGEMSVWAGIFLIGLAANAYYWWTGIGVIAMILLFVYISIPMLDKRMLEKRPGYLTRKKNVPAIIPMKFRKKQL